MKRNAAQREFKKLQGQFKKIEEIAYNSGIKALIEQDISVRKKLQVILEIEEFNLKGYEDLYEGYLGLLTHISNRILDDFNKKNDSHFKFKDVVRENYKNLINSGIRTVLTKEYIPKVIAEEFDDAFPDNPKDEYHLARRMPRKFFIHLGDTNTGKTYNAMQRLKEAKKGIYLSPLRILALEIYERLNKENVVCNLSTGEEEYLKDNATHVSCTIEKANIKKQYDIAVIDEIQMIDDMQRGDAWTRAVLGLPASEIHICGALNSKKLLTKILDACGEEYEIKEYVRRVPLEIETKPFSINDALEGDAIVLFSKKKVLETAQTYSKMGIKASIIYGDLPPEVRKKQYEQFINKETKIIITTDAIGMGVNLPIRRVVFLNTKKFDGEEFRELKSQEVKQIGGRAGRKGIYETGYIATIQGWSNFVRERIEEVDDVIKSAVLGPSEAILTVEGLRLREKLALWKEKDTKQDYYRKMDITEYLLVLDKVKKYKLTDKIEWKLLKVAFDVSQDDLVNTFLNFIDEVFILKYDALLKPQCLSENLTELEFYYQKVNMYYSFSKNFNLKIDMDWVVSERMRVSEEINKILLGL
ncbi:helicase-related protein [uncultured Clostridium sp.]|jgi:ATP-dependent RNA helicase SUPV3L1/SUV3|uniref:helicase-related protein n=1 Tax=uncultured Clostridium sp. TaxID=59620 RepID=UPI0026252C4F|nr:helicase-related protein [uncultured Clostridium sp.]